MGPDRPLRVVDNIGGAWDGAQLMIHLKNHIFCCPIFCQAVGLGVRKTRFLSCLLYSAGFWAAIRPWRPLRARIRHTVLDETGVAGVYSSWSCEADQQAVVSSSCLAQSARPGSVMDVAILLVALANPLHLPFRHIEDACNFSRRLGLDVQHFGFWFDLGQVDRSNVEH